MGVASDVPFVGRETELDTLTSSVQQVVQGTPRIVLLEGDAGIGKTALLHAFLDRLPATARLWASGDETETALRFGVIDQLRAGAGAASLADCGIHPDSFAVGADLLVTLGALSGDRPLVVVVDDLHWVDPESARALLFWLRRLRKDRVLFLGAARRHVEDSLGVSWSRLLADRTLCAHIQLGGLTDREVAVLTRRAGTPLPPGAARRLRDHTAGNPLHVSALLRELPDDLLRDETRSLPAPYFYASTVLARVARTSAPTQDLLAAAAVLGTQCAVRDLLAVAAHAGGRVDVGALDEAFAQALLQPASGSVTRRVGFTHPLMRSALYDALPAQRRATLHRAAAGVLGAPAASAHRVAAADRPDAALADEFAQLAAADLARGAAAESATHLFWSAGLEPDAGRRATRLLEGVELLLASGDVAGARARLPDIAELPDSAFKRYVQAAFAAGTGDLVGARDGLREQATPALAHDDPAVYARVTAALACVAALLGDAGEAVAQARASLGAFRPTGVMASIARQALAFGLAEMGEVSRGLDELDGVSPHGASPPPDQTELVLTRGMLRLWNGDCAAALDDLRTVVRWAKTGHPVSSVATAYAHLAEAEYRSGMWDDALVHAELSTSLGHDLDHRWYLAQSHRVAATVNAVVGNRDAALAHVAAAQVAFRATPHEVARMHAALALATVSAVCGDWNAVLVALAPVRDEVPAAVTDHPAVASWRLLEAEAYLECGSPDRAEAELDRTPRWASLEADRIRIRSRLVRRSDADAAIAMLRAAIAPGRGADAMAGIALHIELGDALLSGARPDRHSAATSAYGFAARSLDGLAAPELRARCERGLLACGAGTQPRTAPHLDSLTMREQLVARLVARGMTNREVAGELFVSTKTVEYHVRNIFIKLGITSRRELWPADGPHRAIEA